MVQTAIEQQMSGAHVLDVCLELVERNEKEDMKKYIHLLNKSLYTPLMIDSTSPEAIEIALKNIGGNAVINSTNFADGDEVVLKYINFCKEYGASLICLAIDENGMAKTTDKKSQILRRFRKLALKNELQENYLFFDPLTFSIATGDETYRNAALESLKFIRNIKKNYPQINILMGVSNVSYGLKKQTRKN